MKVQPIETLVANPLPPRGQTVLVRWPPPKTEQAVLVLHARHHPRSRLLAFARLQVMKVPQRVGLLPQTGVPLHPSDHREHHRPVPPPDPPHPFPLLVVPDDLDEIGSQLHATVVLSS